MRRRNDGYHCYIPIHEDILLPGKCYKIGDHLLHKFTFEFNLTGAITNTLTDLSTSLLCVKSKETPHLIGRSMECDIRLLGEKVSGRHAELAYIEGKWVLSSTGTNGTWKCMHRDYTVGRGESPSYVLLNGAEIRVEGCRYKVLAKLPQLRMSESEVPTQLYDSSLD